MESILNEAVEVCEIDEFKEKMKNYKGAYVYAFFNKINKKVYIGSSRRLVGRFSNYHRAINRTAKFHSLLLKRVFNKYSKEDFWFLILENVENPEQIVNREQFYLDKYKPFGAKGYNCATSASSNFGVKHSEETRIKCRIRQQGEKGLNARLKNADIVNIFKDFAWGDMDKTSIAEKYKMSERQISAILVREQWSHIEIDKETLDQVLEKTWRKIPKGDAEKIGRKLKNGQTPLSLSKEFGIKLVNIQNINRGASYPEIKNKLSPNQEYIFDFHRTNKRNEKLREEIRREMKTNSKITELIKKFPVSKSVVCQIKKELGLQKEQKILTPEKAQEVGLLLKEGIPYKEIVDRCDICQTSITRINRGILFPEVKEIIAPSSPYIRVPPRVILFSVKKKLIFLLRKGSSYKQIREELSLSKNYIWRWGKAFKEKHSQTQNP